MGEIAPNCLSPALYSAKVGLGKRQLRNQGLDIVEHVIVTTDETGSVYR